MNRKELRNIARALSDGESKSVVYHKYQSLIPDDELRSVLAQKSTLSQRNDSKMLFGFLKFIWVIFCLFELAGIVDLFYASNFNQALSTIISLIITLGLCVSVFKGHVLGFSGGMVWFSLGIIRNFSDLFSTTPQELGLLPSEMIWVYAVFFSLILLDVIGLGIMKQLKKRWFPYFGFFTPRRDSSGRIVYEQNAQAQPSAPVNGDKLRD